MTPLPPYRQPPDHETSDAPAPSPAGVDALGRLGSTHTPTPLVRALLGPFLRLGRVPHPAVLSELIAQSVEDVRRDRRLLVALDATEQAAALAAAGRDVAMNYALAGGLILAFGVALGAVLFQARGTYVIAFGPMVVGLILLVRGLRALRNRDGRD